jgi:hypothetical protein
MNKSESIMEIAKALCQFQAEIKNPANSANNPFFKSKYAPLNEILNLVRPSLSKYGLSVLQMPSSNDGDVVITTLLMHSSGEWIESCPLRMKPAKNDPQGIGSAITYGRRYALSAILGISSEDDDDGNSASDNSHQQNNSGKSKDNKQDKQAGKIATISPAQQKLIFAKAAEKGLTPEDVKNQMLTIFKGVIKSTGELSPAQMEELIKSFAEKKDDSHDDWATLGREVVTNE